VPCELGDIVISLETAKRDGLDGIEHELCFLASHGLLHLLGWDHPDEEQLAAMLMRQQQLLELLPAQISGIVA
jgi:probable rRNA maturation factor